MTKPDDEYGLMLEQVNRYGTEYIEVRVCRRDRERPYPVGCPSDGETLYGYGCPKYLVGLVLDGLGMHGFVTDSSEPAYIAYDVEYHDIHGASEAKVARMLKTLKRVNARIAKDDAREAGDKFASLAAALKLSFAVERIARRGNGSPDDWRWMSVAEGRNRYRNVVEKAVATATARKAVA
jgi:hypothetical protein